MLTGVIIAAALGPVHRPALGQRCRTVSGRRPLYLAGAVFTLLFAFPFFGLVDTKEPVLIWLAIVLGVNIGHDLMYGPQGAYFAELFGTRVRYTGASVGYQLASVFAGGFAPLIAVALLAAGDDKPTRRDLHDGHGAITVVATLFARETYQDDIARRRGGARARRPSASCASRVRRAGDRRSRVSERDGLHPRGDADQVRPRERPPTPAGSSSASAPRG